MKVIYTVLCSKQSSALDHRTHGLSQGSPRKRHDRRPHPAVTSLSADGWKWQKACAAWSWLSLTANGWPWRLINTFSRKKNTHSENVLTWLALVLSASIMQERSLGDKAHCHRCSFLWWCIFKAIHIFQFQTVIITVCIITAYLIFRVVKLIVAVCLTWIPFSCPFSLFLLSHPLLCCPNPPPLRDMPSP